MADFSDAPRAIMQRVGTSSSNNPMGSVGEGDLCILTLDGGGARGLSSLLLLENIMIRVNATREKKGEKAMKPCELFDMIGGTSTGGLMAIMLGRLQMEVHECIKAFQTLTAKVFGDRKHMTKVAINGSMQDRFDDKKLEQAIIDMLHALKIPENELFDDGQLRSCRTLVIARRLENSTEVAITDYAEGGSTNPEKMTIVQAALATSAASVLFPEVQVGNQTYVDSTIGVHNPIENVWGMAQKVWAPTGDLRPRLRCLLSIGTGSPEFSPAETRAWKFLTESLTNIATETEETARSFERSHRDLLSKSNPRKYFRWNITDGLSGVGLDEYDKKNIMDFATTQYFTYTPERNYLLSECAEALGTKDEEIERECDYCITTILKPRAGRSGQGPAVHQQEAYDMLWGQTWRDNYDEPASGTLEWLFQSKDDDKSQSSLADWWAAESGMFWIQGKAGSGKSFTIKHLMRKYAIECKKGEIIVGFIFSKLGNVLERNMEGLYRVLLITILRKNKALFNCIKPFFKEHILEPGGLEPIGWHLWSLRTALDIVLKNQDHPANITLFVDAIDECEGTGPKNFIETMGQYANVSSKSRAQVNLKICFSSRAVDTVSPELKLKTPGIILEEMTEDDIAEFIITKFIESPLRFPNDEEKRSLLRLFATKADGCWLWVEWAVESLMKPGYTVDEVRAQITKIPGQLTDLYVSFLSEVPKEERLELRNILGIALATDVTLSVEDFRYILGTCNLESLDSRDLRLRGDFPQDNATMMSRIKRLCGPLLALKPIDSTDEENWDVSFFHPTAQEFLLDIKKLNPAEVPSDFIIDIKKAGNDLLVKACTNVIASTDVKEFLDNLAVAQDPEEIDYLKGEAITELPLIIYATLKIFFHQFKGIEYDENQLETFDDFWAGPNWDTWVGLWAIFALEEDSKDTVRPTLPIVAIQEDASLFLKRQFERGIFNVNETIPIYGHYLTMVASGGSMEMLNMMVELKHPKVDLDATGGRYCTALQAAAYSGRKEFVELLLNKGANPHITGGKFTSPMCAAAFGLHSDVVQLLLTHPRCAPKSQQSMRQQEMASRFFGLRMIVDIVDSGPASRLEHLSETESANLSEMVKTLRGHGIKLEFLNDSLSYIATFLMLKAASPEILEFIVQDPQTITASQSKGVNLLHIACAAAREDVVDFLIKKCKATPLTFLARDKGARTIIHYAVLNDDVSILEKILEIDIVRNGSYIDVNTYDSIGVTPLHVAFAQQSRDHVTTLLDAGAKCPAYNPLHMTLLHFAALNPYWSEHLELAVELRGSKVEVNAHDMLDRTPLHLAAEYGTLGAVMWLLENGAQVDKVDDEGRTPLHCACQNQTRDAASIIELLQRKGLTFSTRDGGGSLPLHRAFYDPKPANKKLYWYNVQDSLYDTFTAAQCRVVAKAVVESMGPDDLNIPDKAGNTPLHLACWRQLADLAATMIARGADPTKRDRNGFKPAELLQTGESRQLLEEVLEEMSNWPMRLTMEPDNISEKSDEDCAVTSGSEADDLE